MVTNMLFYYCYFYNYVVIIILMIILIVIIVKLIIIIVMMIISDNDANYEIGISCVNFDEKTMLIYCTCSILLPTLRFLRRLEYETYIQFHQHQLIYDTTCVTFELASHKSEIVYWLTPPRVP